MPSLIDIRRRIRSVKNTQQITKAMKMVSAAKLRRAQDRVIASRPYGALLRRVLANVAAAAAGDERTTENPLLAARPEERVRGRPLVPGCRGRDVGQHPPQQRPVRPRSDHPVLRPPQLRGGDHFHGLGDLLRVLDRADAPPDVDQARHGRLPASPPRSGP